MVRNLRASVVDVSSADWIIEAPSLCPTASDASCQSTVLANFATTLTFGAPAPAGPSGL